MPIYEYQCENEKCGKVYEVIAKITDTVEKKRECPKCHFWSSLIISKNTFILYNKGTVGWGDTGYKAKES